MLDIVFPGCSTGNRDGQTRRDFLRAGSLGLAGLSLPALVRANARESEANAKKLNAKAKSVILVFLGGGISHLDSFDPKPDAPADIRGKYRPINTNVPGLTIGEMLPLMAKVMDRVTLVRSASHNNQHHETATNWVLSGRFGTPFGDYPAVGAVVAHETGFSGRVPPYVAVPRNPAFTWELGKSAFLGDRYESFKAGDPSRANDDQLLARDMVMSSASRRAFAIDQESARLRDRYGRNTAGQSMLLARRLVENGVRFVTLNYAGWDHHGKIFDALDRRLPEFDKAMSALIEDMDARGTFDETLLVVMSEFGRTPRLNSDAGRDHWGHAGSLLFAGAGVKRGFVLGKTDKHAAFAAERPVSPADVACTILDALGIDPRKQLKAPDSRPIAILDAGESLRELFA
jgi:uncharacterized protein (DUF1501 family)